MALYYAIGIQVESSVVTSNLVYNVPNWSTIKPAYVTYTGSSKAYNLSSISPISTLFTDYNGDKYVVYPWDTDMMGGDIGNYLTTCWAHNDSSSYSHPTDFTVNVGHLKDVYICDMSNAPNSISYNGSTIPVFRFKKYWDAWKDRYGTMGQSYHNQSSQSNIGLDFDYSSYNKIIDVKQRNIAVKSGEDATFPGTYGVTIIQMRYGQTDLQYHQPYHIGLSGGTGNITSSYAGISGAKNIYSFDLKKGTVSDSNKTYLTVPTYINRIFAIHNGGKSNPTYQVGFWGATSGTGTTITNPAYGGYRLFNSGYNTWLSMQVDSPVVNTCYAITVDATSQFILKEIPVQLGKKYTFNIWGDGRLNYDGVVLSKTTLSTPTSTQYSQTLATVYGSNTDVIDYATFQNGMTNSTVINYTPTEDGTVYMYLRKGTNTSTKYQTYSTTTLGDVGLFIADAPAVTVTLDKNNGTGGTNSVSITPGTAAANYPSITLPTRSGYIFQGYFDASTGGTAYYNAAGQGTKVFDKVAAVTLYAHWQQENLPTITVTLNKNGGYGGQGTANVVSGQMIGTVTVPSRDGFKFLGYYSSVSSKSNQYVDETGTGCKTISSNITLYALWENTISYELLYSVQNPKVVTYSSSSQSITVSDGGWVCAGGTISNVQYSFNGTVSSLDGGLSFKIPSKDVATYTLSVTLTSPTSSVANGYFGTTQTYSFGVRYIQKNIEFHLLGQEVYSPNTAQAKVRAEVAGTLYWGTSSSSMTSTQSVPAGLSNWTSITSATQTSVGTKTIYGYFVPSSNNYNWVGGVDNPGDSAVLKVLAAATTVTITLNDNGGFGGSGSIVVEKNSTCSSWSSVSVPTRAGFTFMGYFTVNTATGGSQVYQSSGSPYYGYSTSSNVTIYARWKINISYTHNNISAESATEEFVSNQPGEATSTSSTVTFQIDGGQINCVASSWTISILDSDKTSWTINSTGTTFTVPSGTSYTYSPTYFRWKIVVANGTYNSYPYVGNTLQSGYTWETDTPRPIYYYLKKVEYVKDSNSNIIKYKAINGAEGFNLTSTGTPNIGTSSFDSPRITAEQNDTYVYSYTLTNERSWYQKYTNGTWDTSLKTGTYSVYPKWRIISGTFTRTSDGQVSNIERFHAGNSVASSQLLIDGVYRTVYDTSTTSGDFVHESMGENLGTDTVVFRLYNPDDTSKYQEVTKSVQNELNITKYKDSSCSTSGTNFTYVNPTVSIGSGITAGGGSATVTCTVTNNTDWYQKYKSNYVGHFTGTSSGTAKWCITSNGNSRFSHPSSGSSTITVGGNSVTVYNTGTKVSHSNMAKNLGEDSVTVTAYNTDDTTKSATASKSVTNTRTWGDITYSITPATPYSMSNAGETVTISVTRSQTGTYTSGSSDSYTPTVSYSVNTSKTGYTLNTSNGKVTVTNNTSATARNGFKATVSLAGKTGTDSTYDTGYNKTTSSTRTFNQPAGEQIWDNPEIEAWTYPPFAATGATNTPAGSSWTQYWTWNGVAGTGDGINGDEYTGTVTWAYTKGTLPSGCTAASTFATTGSITWVNNTTASTRDAASVISATITVNGKTSAACTCYQCKQDAGEKVYANPTVTGYSYANFAADGSDQNKIPTVTYTQAYTWNGVSGSGDTDSYTYDASHTNPGGTRAFTAGTLLTGFTKGTNFATTGAATWGNNTSTSTREAKSILSVTVTVNSKTSSSFTCTSCKQNAGAKVYANPTVTGYSYANFSAAGESSKYPTVTYTQAYTWNGVSGSGSTDSYTYDSSHTSPGGTFAFTVTGSLTSGFSKGTSFATSGRITAASRGTTIGNARNCTSKLSVVVTVNSKASASFTCSGCIQNGNYVTVVAPRASSGTTHIVYADIGPGATSAPVTTNDGATYTFTSGSTSTSVPSTSYGSVTYSRTYTLGSVQNGFTAVNSSGTLTVTSKGTTVGGPWTSGNVTSVLTVTWTHSSSYSAGGTKSGTMTSTVTCTQTANALTGLAISVGTNPINYGGTSTCTVTATYTSGATKNVDCDTNTTYSFNPTGVVTVTKS